MKVPVELLGCQVTRTSFDHQVRLLLVGRSLGDGRPIDAELVIEVPFHLRDAAGERHELGPGAGLAPVLDLFQTTVTDLVIDGTGGLTMSFDSGAVLVVTPRPEFEAWSLSGTGVSGVMVGPGGEKDWQL